MPLSECVLHPDHTVRGFIHHGRLLIWTRVEGDIYLLSLGVTVFRKHKFLYKKKGG